jgi:hypothetical protein
MHPARQQPPQCADLAGGSKAGMAAEEIIATF